MNVQRQGPNEKRGIQDSQVPGLMEEITKIGNHSLEDWSKAIRAEISELNINIGRFMEAGLAIEELRPVRRNVLRSLGYDPNESKSKAFVEVALWETLKKEDPAEATRIYGDLMVKAGQRDRNAIQRIESIRNAYEEAGFSPSYFDILPKIRPLEWRRIRRTVHRIVGSVEVERPTTEPITLSHHRILRTLRDVHRSTPDEYEGTVDRVFSLLRDEKVRKILDDYNKSSIKDDETMKDAGDKILGLLDQNERNRLRVLTNPEQRTLMFFSDMDRVMRRERIL